MLLFNVMPIAVECTMALGVMASLAGLGLGLIPAWNMGRRRSCCWDVLVLWSQRHIPTIIAIYIYIHIYIYIYIITAYINNINNGRIWLVVWNMNFVWLSHHIGNVIIPTVTHSIIFQRGGSTTRNDHRLLDHCQLSRTGMCILQPWTPWWLTWRPS